MAAEIPENMSLFNSNTLIEEGTLVHAVLGNGTAVTGTVSKIVLLPCEQDDNRLHTLLFITQDKRYIKQEGKIGLVSEWFDNLKSLEMIEEPQKNTSERNQLIDEYDQMIAIHGMKTRYPMCPPPEPQKTIMITNVASSRKEIHYWVAYYCLDGELQTEPGKPSYHTISAALSCEDQSFIFSIAEFLYRLDYLRTLDIPVIVDTDWWINSAKYHKRLNKTDTTPKKTPTSDCFEEVLNDLNYPPEQKVLVISKFDEEGNWSAFHCARDGESLVYGGQIGLCSSAGDSYLTPYDLLYWFDRFRKRGVDVIVDANWFMKGNDTSNDPIS